MNEPMRLLILFVALSISASSCSQSAEQQELFNGISLVGNPSPIAGEDLLPLVNTAANAVALMPFAYGRSGSPNLRWKDLSWQWWGEGYAGVEACVKLAQAKGLQVMIKPQLWFDRGTYTGFFQLETDAEWEMFEQAYASFILQYAALSEAYRLPVFCIGTELIGFIEARPAFWRELIREVRLVYSGKVTYAGNWDSYARVPFWDDLDYIGVDAYFPVCAHETPAVATCVKGWAPYKRELKAASLRWERPVLFTEWGYRSTDFCAREPWDYSESRPFNGQAQANAIEAVFQAIWDEPWFAGGFIWKWNADHNKSGGNNDTRFTPQNKLAESVLRTYFGAHGSRN